MHLAAYRKEFPVGDGYVYLNHAATGPLPRRSAEAMQALAADQMTAGSMHYRDWLAVYAGLREAAARLIGGGPAEIALTKNTSEGLSFVANGLGWRPGDVVVGVSGEFPANYFPWARLADRGVELRWVPLRNGRIDLEELDRACQDARLLAVSFVQYLSGFRLDLDAVGEICRRRGCLLVVDAVQGLGPFPVDVKRSGIHALSASGHKWLLGPEGCAFLYLDPALMEQLEVVEMGWTNVRGFPLYSTELDLRPDAGRFECGTLNTIGCSGLKASIELFLEAGVEAISRQVLTLAAQTAFGARERGFELAAERDDASGSGIVSIRRADVDSSAVAARLAEQKVSISARHGYLRVAPHFHNTSEQIDRFFELLGKD